MDDETDFDARHDTDPEPTEYILTQEQMDAVEHMMTHYAQMLQVFVGRALRLPPGPEKDEASEGVHLLEAAMMEVARTLFPERHAHAVAAKELAMRIFNSPLN